MLDVVILAAGQGSRMKSALPKVLHRVGGKPMVQHVIDVARPFADRIILVVGHGREAVEAELAGQDLVFVEQTEQKGTGHALAQALPHLNPEGLTLMLYGDGPLVERDDIQAMIDAAQAGHYAVLTANFEDPAGYGRIIRENGEPVAIVEQKDASAAQRAITEVNTGLIATSTQSLARYLPNLSTNNAQGEYYVTDCLAMAVEHGQTTQAVVTQNPSSTLGANDRIQLAELERLYQTRERRWLMQMGATLLAPERVVIQGQVTVGQDVVIEPDVMLKGTVVLGDRVEIGQGCIIEDTEIEAGTRIEPYSVLQGARVASGAQVGPMARLRPGAVLEAGAKAGNFVEVKNATLREGAKANHLTYVGDADIGPRTNLGAGTITCNYDGANKHKTVPGADVFVGSNSALVAPVTLGAGVTVGAGSVITRDVEKGLALTRAQQTELAGYTRPVKGQK